MRCALIGPLEGDDDEGGNCHMLITARRTDEGRDKNVHSLPKTT